MSYLPKVDWAPTPVTMTYKLQKVTHVTLMRWVRRNSGPIFRRLWTKVHQIKNHAQKRLQFASPFSVRRYRLSFLRYSRSRCQVVRLLCPNFDVFRPPFFWGEGPKFLTQFHKFGSPSRMCYNLVTIDGATSEIRCWKKIKKTRWAGQSPTWFRPAP